MMKREEERFARLVDWVEGRLSEGDGPISLEAARGTEASRDELAWLERFHEARRKITFVAPPPSVREELERRFSRYAADRRAPGFIERIQALLTFDSASQWGVAGARSAASQGLEQQLIFTATETEVALNLVPRPDLREVDVSGQVFTSDESDLPFSVQLLDGTSEVAITTTDELGEFEFTAVPPGQYEIILSGSRVEVVLTPVAIGE